MPLYEYRCLDCDEKFERYVRAWGDAVVCPACESGSVDKLLSTFAFAAAEGSFCRGRLRLRTGRLRLSPLRAAPAP
jgi:putative FmdB family regulatory protein